MKPIGYISAILFIIVLSILIFVGELFLLDTYPPQLPGDVTLGQWMTSFKKWASICIASAAFASLLWYILAQWGFKINRWEDTGGKRPIWLLLFLIPIIMTVISCIYIEPTESNQWLIYLFFLLNGLLPYYVTTLLLSPSTFKYIPVGAKKVRSQCFW